MTRNNKIENNRNMDLYARDDTKSIYSFFALAITIPLLIIIGYLLSFIPNTLDTDIIKNTYNLPLKDFAPEKSETCQYLILSVLFPILFCIFYMIFSNTIKKNGMHNLSSVAYPTELVLICVVSIWSMLENYYGVEGFSYTTNVILTAMIVVCIVIWAVMLTLMSIYHEKIAKFRKKIYIPVLLTGIAATIFASWFYLTDNYFFNGFTLHHFEAYFYPVFEVYNGKTLLVDFTSLYGFYPYLMAPVFKLIGGISIYRFSILITILVLVNASAIGLSIWISVKNKIIALLGFIAIIFVSLLAPIIINDGYYLQYMPHRTLFPSLLILLCTLYIKTDRVIYKKILVIAGYMLCSLSLFWNIDTGAVVIVAWCLFRMYVVALRHTLKEVRLYIGFIRIIFFACISAGIMIFSVLMITYFRSGQLVTLQSMISSQILFKGTGFFMLPMQLQHTWIILAMIYMAGLVKSLGSLPFLNKSEIGKSKKSTTLYFLISILGVGLFSYYQGRSHRDVFVAVVWPGVMLIILFANEYAEKVVQQLKFYKEMNSLKKARLFTDASKLFITIGVLLTLTVTFITLDYNDNSSIIFIKAIDTKYSQKTIFDNNLKFINKNNSDNEKVDLLIGYFTEYYSILQVKNPMPIRSNIDWFTKDDYQEVINYLNVTDNKVFLDKKITTLLMTYVPKEFTAVINKRFALVDTLDAVKCYKPIPGQ